MSKSMKVHLKAVKQTFQYLISIKDIDLIYEKRFSNTNFHDYTDSNFVADENNRQFMSEFLFKLNEACIHWQSKQQSLIAHSTHETEYVDMTVASYKISYF